MCNNGERKREEGQIACEKAPHTRTKKMKCIFLEMYFLNVKAEVHRNAFTLSFVLLLQYMVHAEKKKQIETLCIFMLLRAIR